MKGRLLLLFALCAINAYSQNSINNYRYVIVPVRFDFAKADDQYGLNTLTKLMLEAKGFTAFVGNKELPQEVVANPCNALKAEVVEKKGIFVTNLSLLLKDCQGNVIFKSKEGKSREKEFQVAYDEALRNAFASLNDVPYKYDGTTVTQPAPATTTPVASPSAPIPAPMPASPAAVTEITGTLYAQAIPNGYQLVDTAPKKVLTLLKTSLPDYFIAEAAAWRGVVFKKNGEWFFEYYKDNQLVSQKLEIRF